MAKAPLVPIGEAAAQVGISVRTLRYYQEVGLLEPTERGPGGVRQYTEAEIQRVKRIIELRNSRGFTLEEVKEFLAAEEGLDATRASYNRSDVSGRLSALDRGEELLRRELAVVEAKMAGLTELRGEIMARLERAKTLRRQLTEPSQAEQQE